MILDGTLPESIAAAARAVRSGALLGLPTETVYGLAADASSDAAVAQIFAAKGRPSDHPLIVHVADASGIAHFAREVPGFAQKLVDAFWPGPLTLILPRRPGVATAASLLASAARPYTVSVGRPSSAPLRTARAAAAMDSGWVPSRIMVKTARCPARLRPARPWRVPHRLWRRSR